MTAVEWLYKNLLDNPMSNEDVIYNINIFEQAKEMFEQQIIDAYQTSHISMMTAEQYYNETYNK